MRCFGVLSLLGLALKVTAEQKVVVGYYVPWGKVAPEALPYEKVTHINYGFGVVYKRDDPASIVVDRYYDGSKMRAIKKLASAKGVKVLMSIGGWTGSQTFSLAARDPGLRAKLIDNMLVFVRKNTKPEWETNPDGWDMDGIDLDWEYPGRAAAKCNVYAPDDSANYLLLLKELRAALDKEFPNDHKLITAAVRVKPFDGPDGKPMADVSAFAKYFDFINIMAYDIMGSWSNTIGPNAPFVADTVKGGDSFSYTQGIDDWLAAGFPPSKLTAGLAFYGRTLTSTVDMNKTPTNMYQPKEGTTPKGDASDANDPNFFCNEGSVYSGVYKYKYLRQDALSSPTTAMNGYTRHFDNITQTPWLFHAQSKKFISYDDPQSLQIKVTYAKKKNLRGVMYWDMAQDFNDELLDVAIQIRNGANPQPTTVPTSTPPTSSPSTTTVPTSPPVPTGSCQPGQQKCVSEGTDPQYLLCLYGDWVPSSCASGTVCRTTTGSQIFCDHP
ncbi:hypothetical protein DSO57_1026045 [Entomophthora muscae]|uniref:Uncharacterized protein n=1 Tax=Entomophthora muscae TaxID=34485 RepID=A0ACC2T289_9FUNG|nr:hypothetical protein DSO57_1026045 [Entomophthora muscae]